MPSELTCVRKAASDGEAQQLRAFLASHEIPCELHGGVAGRMLGGAGGIEVCVVAEHADAARALLAQVDAGELTLPGGPEPV